MSEDKFRDQVLTLEDLGISTTEKDIAIIPSAGEGFPASSFIARWTATICSMFMTMEDYVLYNQQVNEDERVKVPFHREPVGDYYHMYYYQDYAGALDAYTKLDPDEVWTTGRSAGKHKTPNSYWLFMASTDSILNAVDLDKVKAGFGDRVVWNARIMVLRKENVKEDRAPPRDRHVFGLISLPAAVAAAATVQNLANDGFDLSELLDPDAEDNISEELYHALCGDPRGDFESSILFQRRAKLWVSLGEDDPHAKSMINSKTARGNPDKGATTSAQLSKCLSIAQGKWTRPLWGRVVQVPDPRPDAVSASGNRLHIPVLTELYKSEEHARMEANEELRARGQEVEEESPIPIPSGWKVGEKSEWLTEWIKYLRENDDPKVKDNSPAPKRKELMEALYADNWEQVVAARGYEG